MEKVTRSFGLIIDDEISEPVRYEVKDRKNEVPRLGSGELSIYYPSARPSVCAPPAEEGVVNKNEAFEIWDIEKDEPSVYDNGSVSLAQLDRAIPS